MNEPTKIFVGVTTNSAANKARYVSKVYVGDSGGVARKVRKGYIGDQYNKARLFFNALPELEKQTVSGTLYRNYRNGQTDTNGAELANNVVFGNDFYSAASPKWYGTRINADLTVHPISNATDTQYYSSRMFTPLGANATRLAGKSTGATSVVGRYTVVMDDEFTTSSVQVSGLTNYDSKTCGDTYTSNHALFNYIDTSDEDSYVYGITSLDKELTSATTVEIGRTFGGAHGGVYMGGSAYGVNPMLRVNDDLTYTVNNLFNTGSKGDITRADNVLICSGGERVRSGSTYQNYNYFSMFDEELTGTRIKTIALGDNDYPYWYDMKAGHTPSTAIFAGGRNGQTSTDAGEPIYIVTRNVYAFDKYGTQLDCANLVIGRYSHGSGSVGDYCIFAGGHNEIRGGSNEEMWEVSLEVYKEK